MRLVIATVMLASVCVMVSRPTVLVAQGSPVQTIKDGVLDEVKLYAAKLPESKTVVIRPFSATDADITEGEKKDETKKMQPLAPGILADEFVKALKPLGPFSDVTVQNDDSAPAGAIVIEGKFKEMDPGSRAKRYFVGYGAGKSGVKVEGTVKGPDGTVLATFTQRRVGVMGVGGGDSMDKLRNDTKTIGEDIAKFLNAWATNKKLK